MPNPAHEVAILGSNPYGETQIHLLSDTGPARLAASLGSSRWYSYSGVAYVLVDPAPIGGVQPPWRKGDILVSRTQSRLGTKERALVRLRPVTVVGRNVTAYAADVIFSASGSGIQGLALDPHGRIYAGSKEGGKIYRYEPSREGGLRERAWATIPSSMPWQGDIGLSPDGMLFISAGAGNESGKLYKFSIGGDPRPFPQVQQIKSRSAFSAIGAMAGFAFYDNDTVLFTDGRDVYYSGKIDPTLDALEPPPPPTIAWPPSLSPGAMAVTYRDPAIGGFEIRDIAVMRNAFQTYLEGQDEVRSRILWSPEPDRSERYDEWNVQPGCEDLERRLHRMYAWIAAREPAPLGYRFRIDPDTGKPRIGPETVGDRSTIRRDDAVDAYLALVGHCLWAQIHNQVPWELHEQPSYGISLLLNSAQTYRPQGGPDALYALNTDVVVNAIPSDPVECFAFLTGSDPAVRNGASFIKDTQAETVVAFTKWVQVHTTHGYGPNESEAIALYGYRGLPPVSTMYQPILDPAHPNDGVNYWAWSGCQSAAGFMVHLMRLLLIPSKRLKLYEWVRPGEEAYHGGAAFPTAQLGCYHVDSFYAVTSLRDKNLDPLEVYNGGPAQSYSDYIHRFDVQNPNDQADIETKGTDYYQEEGRIALRNRTFEMQRLFWEGRIEQPHTPYQNRSYRFLKTLLDSIHHLTGGEVQTLIGQHGDQYERYIDQFMIDHQSELPSSGTVVELLRAGRELYVSLHK